MRLRINVRLYIGHLTDNGLYDSLRSNAFHRVRTFVTGTCNYIILLKYYQLTPYKV